MDELLSYIRSLTDFNEENWTLLQAVLQKVNYSKNEFLLKEGQHCNTLFFIEKGYCRCYYNIDGAEKNTNFFFENEIAASPSSLNNIAESRHNIVACEPITAIQFDKDRLKLIARDAAQIERMGRHFIHKFALKENKFSDLIRFHSAEERLDYIEKMHPEMIQRVSLSQLSSFLGVTRETLSRIRKQRIRT